MTRSRAKVAIIGAGMAGAACAQALRSRGIAFDLFEKSRGVGGRIATRRVDDDLAFDHGAQADYAETVPYRDYLAGHVDNGDLAPWPTRPPDEPPSFIGAPRANSHIRADLDGVAVMHGARVIDIAPMRPGWLLTTDSGLSGDYEVVVVAAPAPQAASLLRAHDRAFAALDDVRMAPCWAVMVSPQTPLAATNDADEGAGEIIARIINNSAKPGRPTAPQCWLAHGSAAWSAAHLEAAPEEIPDLLLRHLPAALQPLRDAPARYRQAHRWRYAFTEKPAGSAILASQNGTLIAAGDWCLGDRIEHAFLSGNAAAAAVVEYFS